MAQATSPKSALPGPDSVAAEIAQGLRLGSRQGDESARAMAHLAESTAEAVGADPAPFRSLALHLAEGGLTPEKRAQVRTVLGLSHETWDVFSWRMGLALNMIGARTLVDWGSAHVSRVPRPGELEVMAAIQRCASVLFPSIAHGKPWRLGEGGWAHPYLVDLQYARDCVAALHAPATSDVDRNCAAIATALLLLLPMDRRETGVSTDDMRRALGGAQLRAPVRTLVDGVLGGHFVAGAAAERAQVLLDALLAPPAAAPADEAPTSPARPKEAYDARVLSMHAAIEKCLRREPSTIPTYAALREVLSVNQSDGSVRTWGTTTISQTLARMERHGLLDRADKWVLYSVDAPRRSEAGVERESGRSDANGKRRVNDAPNADRKTHHPRGRRKARRPTR